MTGLLICTALGIEARAVRGGLSQASRDDLSEASQDSLSHTSRGDFSQVSGNGLSAEDVKVIRIGMGPGRAASAAALLPSTGAVAVVGFGGALGGGLRPGDVLVASEVRFEGRVLPCPSARFLAGELARAGLPAHSGPLVTSGHIVTGAERRRLAREGALAVDMETGPLAGAAADRPFAALRVIVDTPAVPLIRPATIRGGITAYRTLRRLGPILARWAATTDLPYVPLTERPPPILRMHVEETIRMPYTHIEETVRFTPLKEVQSI
ncbi:hypothetical protein AB0M44_03435 [Streptosporangium subroseum]|uniref:phosphorylase family protein n=1 Tax=Streptosporangium subroseum TaxID=106412 RepID=UPI00343145CB